MDKLTPKKVFEEINRDEEYKNAISLFENVKRNNDFYHDKQWEGLNAPNLDKPVFNILKPCVNYYVGQLVSDDIGVSVDIDYALGISEIVQQGVEKLLQDRIRDVFEVSKFNYKMREFIRNSAIDGDGCLYWYYDTKTDKIKCQLINNTDIVFGDQVSYDVEKQPYIIIRQRILTKTLRKRAKEMGIKDWESIASDTQGSSDIYNLDKTYENYTEVALRFWKENGIVHWMECTKELVLREPQSLLINRYPFVWMPWEHDKNSYHGISPLTGQIPNQIFVNKIYAMAMEYQKSFAFPKLLFDRTKIQKWNNKVGQAIGVNGDPREAIFASFAPSGMNDQAILLAESTITKTKDSMGVYDAALGNVKPDNTSAIIAVQQASSQPLMSQKLDYYQAVEDSVYIIIEFTKAYQYLQTIVIRDEQKNEFREPIDLRNLNLDKVTMRVDIGASSYWNELLQVQTIDNMMMKDILPNAVIYLESLPDGFIKNKSDLIRKIKEYELQSQQQMMQAQMMQNAPQAVERGV